MKKYVYSWVLCVLLAAAQMCSPPANCQAKAKAHPFAAVGTPANIGLARYDFKAVDVAAMTRDADLIAVGRFKQEQGPRYLEIVHGMKNPNNSAAHMPLKELKAQMFLTLDCDRVLKGDSSLKGKLLKWVDPNWENNISVDAVHGVTYNQNSNGGIPQLTYGIFFLKKNNGGWKFVDLNHCVLPASPTAANPASEPFATVVNELVNVLAGPLDLLSTKGGATGGESGSGTRGEYSITSGEVLMRDAAVVISQLPKDVVVPKLKALVAHNNSPMTKLWSFATLVSLGDWSCFSQVEPYLLKPDDKLKYVCSYPVETLHDKLQMSQSQTVLPTIPSAQIAKLMASQDTSIRQSASFILAQKNDRAFLNVLASAATKDSDETVRANCTSGLAKMTNFGVLIWEKEPTLAMELATKESSVGALFDQPFKPGVMFEQSKTAPQIARKFSQVEFDRRQLPQWIQQAAAAENAKNAAENSLRGGLFSEDALSEFLPTDGQPAWSWAGAAYTAKQKKKFWYMYTRTYCPTATTENQFAYRTTTVCILIELKDDNGPRFVAINQLPPAKMLDAWREDVDVIFKRMPNNVLRVIRIRKIYGSDGKPRQVVPSGMKAEASMRDISG